MSVLKIMASLDELIFSVEGFEGEAVVRELVPIPGGRELSRVSARAEAGEMRIPRFDGGRDRLASRFETTLGGAVYVSDLLPGCSVNNEAYPQPERIKALHGRLEDMKELGLTQTLININLPALLAVEPGDAEVIDFVSDGRVYHFLKEKIDRLDRYMREMDENGFLVTMILLNSPRMFDSTQEPALLEKAIHPRYEWDAKDAFLSAFDMEREEGQGYYRAFVEFLAARYTRADREYGRAMGAIISNEVDSQCVWSNAGEMSCEEFTHEYSEACRLAWLLGRKHFANFRVYMSLDQFFSGVRFRPLEPLHTYPGREVIDRMNAHCLREGNFGWGIAYHPYPEDLRYPDFWNDRAPEFNHSTPKITFKNMEVLPDYLSKSELLYEGAPRRIIFSEQGFNSQQGPLQGMTEKQAAAAYCLAYLKARKIPTLDLFTHHSYLDNPHEFGLNLGIRRYDPAVSDHVGERKPIYETIRDMDTDREPECILRAREFIGAELFDYLLDPPLHHGDADRSSDTDFGN